ncbi:hypothetical protein AAVH_07186 [Aphelenchoides avenae]|nr:hypothetical protein AAVH_07186 [Aphelenchus avenae]
MQELAPNPVSVAIRSAVDGSMAPVVAVTSLVAASDHQHLAFIAAQLLPALFLKRLCGAAAALMRCAEYRGVVQRFIVAPLLSVGGTPLDDDEVHRLITAKGD